MVLNKRSKHVLGASTGALIVVQVQKVPWQSFEMCNVPMGIFANNEGLEVSKNYTWHRSLNEENLTDVKYTSIGITFKTDVYLSIEVLCPKWEDSLQGPWDKGQVNSPTLFATAEHPSQVRTTWLLVTTLNVALLSDPCRPFISVLFHKSLFFLFFKKVEQTLQYVLNEKFLYLRVWQYLLHLYTQITWDNLTTRNSHQDLTSTTLQ